MVFYLRQNCFLDCNARRKDNKNGAQGNFAARAQNFFRRFFRAKILRSESKNILCQILCKSRKTIEKQKKSVV